MDEIKPYFLRENGHETVDFTLESVLEGLADDGVKVYSLDQIRRTWQPGMMELSITGTKANFIRLIEDSDNIYTIAFANVDNDPDPEIKRLREKYEFKKVKIEV